jgi:hypothetical protein
MKTNSINNIEDKDKSILACTLSTFKYTSMKQTYFNKNFFKLNNNNINDFKNIKNLKIHNNYNNENNFYDTQSEESNEYKENNAKIDHHNNNNNNNSDENSLTHLLITADTYLNINIFQIILNQSIYSNNNKNNLNNNNSNNNINNNNNKTVSMHILYTFNFSFYDDSSLLSPQVKNSNKINSISLNFFKIDFNTFFPIKLKNNKRNTRVNIENNNSNNNNNNDDIIVIIIITIIMIIILLLIMLIIITIIITLIIIIIIITLIIIIIIIILIIMKMFSILIL